MAKRRKHHLKIGFKVLLLLIVLIGIIYLNRDNIFKSSNSYVTESVYKDDVINDIIENLKLDDSLSTLEKLNILKEYNKKIDVIIKNYDKYPETLLEMLTRDLDLLDFVIDYPDSVGSTYSDDVGKIDDDIPLLLQWDKRWGYALYGDSSVAIDGCGPTSLAMVVVGLTKDKTMTPAKIANFSQINGYYYPNVGTSWNLMTEGANKLGVNSRVITLSKNNIFTALENGHPLICSMRKGDFTTSGHFIVLVGLEDGKIKVNDPNSIKRSNKLWTYEELEPQIKNVWEYYL